MQRWLLTIFESLEHPPRPWQSSHLRAVLFTFAFASVVSPAGAQVPVEAVRRFVQNELGTIEGAARVEISVGQTETRQHLAPCDKAEPFARSGARLWGRAFVGLRCVSGAQWTISVPVQVRVYGPALVALRALLPGQPVDESDIKIEQVEWTRDPQGVVRDLAQLRRRVPVRTIEPGEPLGLGLLREVPAVAQGDPVKVIGRGQGFLVTTDAVALAAAPAGQAVRVRVESGKILTGTAREGRIVEVLF
jgi:flagella basal body P-ring formation protein FlgA